MYQRLKQYRLAVSALLLPDDPLIASLPRLSPHRKRTKKPVPPPVEP